LKELNPSYKEPNPLDSFQFDSTFSASELCRFQPPFALRQTQAPNNAGRS
jgi:hypothetical protein